MPKLTKEELKEIVDNFGHLAEHPYAEEFCWEADVGRDSSPLQFAAEVRDHYNSDFCTALSVAVEEHLVFMINEFTEEMLDRDIDHLGDDILRNIARDAIDELAE